MSIDEGENAVRWFVGSSLFRRRRRCWGLRSFVLRCRRRRRCLGLRSFFVVVVVWAFVVVVYIFVVVAAFFGVLHLCVVSVATTCTVVASLLVRTFVFSFVRSLVYLHCRT